MANKTIPALPIYGSQDSDKRKKDLIEITKNDGTYATPTYGTGASRKMSVEELKTALDITSQTVTDGITDKSPSENAVFDAVYAKGLINGTIWVNAYTALGDFNLSIDKYNNVGYTDAEGPISVILPTHTASMSGKTIIVEPHRFNSGLTTVNISIPGLQVDGGGGAGTYTEVITKMGQIVTIQANYYGWHVIGHTNQVPDLSPYSLLSSSITDGDITHSPDGNAVFDALALKLDLSGANANQDIDIDGFGVNAKHFKVNGTGGAGHIGLKHQSANISASASESSIGANSVGDPVWKNDGGAIDKLELQSNKTNTVTGNEASTTKYLTVKGVYDWAVGLFAPKASPTFTGTVTTPDIVVSNATASTPAFFDAVDKLISTTAQLWGTWVQTWASKATPVDADTIGFYNSASTFVGVKSTLLNFWTTYLLPKVQSLSYAVNGGLTNTYHAKYNGTSLVNSLISDDGSTYADLNANSTQSTLRLKTNTTGITGLASVQLWDKNTTVFESSGIYSDNNSFGVFSLTAKDFRITRSGNLDTYQLRLKFDNTFETIGKVQINKTGSTSNSYSGLYIANTDAGNGLVIEPTTAASNLTSIRLLDNRQSNSFLSQINFAGTNGFAENGYTAGEFAITNFVNGRITHAIRNGIGNGTPVRVLASYPTGTVVSDTDITSISASSCFEVKSTTRGFLPPKMTNAQRTAIASPAVGLMVYCTDATEGLWINKSTGWTFIA